MDKFIGQQHIIEYIQRKKRDTFPRSLILLGPDGCGKHSVVNMIGEKFQLPVVDISEQLSFEFILQLQERPEPSIYILEADKLTIKNQNMILKFIEEPLKNAFIIVIAETANQLLETVYNRCQKLTFLPYTEEELKQFTDNELVLTIAETPGQIQTMLDNDFEGMLLLAGKMVNKLAEANIANVLTISDKFAYKKEKDKFDLKVFARIWIYILKTKIENEPNCSPKYFDYYCLVKEWNVKRKAPTISQKFLLENYLVKLHNLMRS